MIAKVIKSFQFRYPRVASYVFLERPLVEVPVVRLHTQLPPQTHIPRVVYQTWDVNFFGRSHAAGLGEFRDKNPEFDFFIYSSDAMDEFMAFNYADHKIYQVYKMAKIPAMKADIWRYCIVYKKGGFYFDINKRVSVPLAQLVREDDKAIVAFENNLLVDVRPKDETARLPMGLNFTAASILEYTDRPILNWGFGFEAGHPFLKRTIDNIVRHADYYQGKVFKNVRDPIIELTGPHMFTRSIYSVLDESPSMAFRQLGIDFDGYGDPNMRGSWVRYAASGSYVRAHDQSILE